MLIQKTYFSLFLCYIQKDKELIFHDGYFMNIQNVLNSVMLSEDRE